VLPDVIKRAGGGIVDPPWGARAMHLRPCPKTDKEDGSVNPADGCVVEDHPQASPFNL
jgi:hypothetical protein